MSVYVCYLLRTTTLPVHTYVGVTTDLCRRLRQHNGALKGGARRTRGRQWEIVLYVTGFQTKSSAMKFEYRFKHSGRGVHGRTRGVGRLVGGRTDMVVVGYT